MVTCWTGRFSQAQWFTTFEKAIRIYGVEKKQHALNCMDNPDGTTYDKHELSDEEWVVVPQIALLLEPFNEAITVLQGSKYITGSLVLPTISSLHHVTSPGEDMLDDDNCVVRMHPAINAGRQTLHEDLQRRFMEYMDISKVVGGLRTGDRAGSTFQVARLPTSGPVAGWSLNQGDGAWLASRCLA